MPKLILVPRLCPPDCFKPIKKCNVTPILHLSARKNQTEWLIVALYGQNNDCGFVSDEEAAVSIIIAYEQFVMWSRPVKLERASRDEFKLGLWRVLLEAWCQCSFLLPTIILTPELVTKRPISTHTSEKITPAWVACLCLATSLCFWMRCTSCDCAAL